VNYRRIFTKWIFQNLDFLQTTLLGDLARLNLFSHELFQFVWRLIFVILGEGDYNHSTQRIHRVAWPAHVVFIGIPRGTKNSMIFLIFYKHHNSPRQNIKSRSMRRSYASRLKLDHEVLRDQIPSGCEGSFSGSLIRSLGRFAEVISSLKNYLYP